MDEVTPQPAVLNMLLDIIANIHVASIKPAFHPRPWFNATMAAVKSCSCLQIDNIGNIQGTHPSYTASFCNQC